MKILRIDIRDIYDKQGYKFFGFKARDLEAWKVEQREDKKAEYEIFSSEFTKVGKL